MTTLKKIQILIEGVWIFAEVSCVIDEPEEFSISGCLPQGISFPEGTNKLLVNQWDKGGEYFIPSLELTYVSQKKGEFDFEEEYFFASFSTSFKWPDRLKFYLVNFKVN
jgi:hypothetical protein